jgi:poly-beta-1,6-N-acetyl-D-glucosamine synthase
VTARELAFWGSAAACGWILLGYPAVLVLAPPKPWRRSGSLPSVTLIVPAYRERESLARKLRALKGLDYPRDRLCVIVAIDEDPALVDIAEAAYPGARVSFSPERGGKVAAINRALTHAEGEIVVLTDANNVLEHRSVRKAAEHFGDPSVWGVAGRRGEKGSAYDRYEDLVRRLEARSGSVGAASGEFIALRRERFASFPPDVVNDDFWLLCRLVRDGGRVVYEPAAMSLEERLPPRAEHARRSRMGAGRVMLLPELRGLPRGFALRLISHKYGRLTLPFFSMALLVSSASLGRRPVYLAVTAVQAAAYILGGLALAGHSPGGPAGRLARAASQYMVGNAAVVVGVARAIRGRQSVRWEPVA